MTNCVVTTCMAIRKRRIVMEHTFPILKQIDQNASVGKGIRKVLVDFRFALQVRLKPMTFLVLECYEKTFQRPLF